MRKLSFCIIALLVAMAMNAQDETGAGSGTVIAEIDFSGGYEGDFPYWYQFDDNQDGSVTSDPDGVAITVGSQTGNLWQPQVMVIPDKSFSPDGTVSFNLEEEEYYKVVITAKFPTDGTLQINMGSWSANDQDQFDVTATGDFQEVVCEFPGWSVDADDAHLLFQCGDFLGTIILKKIQIISMYPKDTPASDICYNFNAEDKTAEVISNDGKYKGSLVIPEKVMHDGEEFTVAKIGDYAFSNCHKLSSVTIPKSVKSIGRYAFRDCPKLSSFVVEEGNTEFDVRDNCYAIINSKTNELVVGCKNTIIPNSVTSIGDGAFYCCYDLTSIKIPDNVTTIGDCAFSYCNGLTSIEIPQNVKSIGNYAFSRCLGLTKIEIPKSVINIGTSAFSGCGHVTSIVVEDGNTMYASPNNCDAIIRSADKQLIAGCTNTIIPNNVTSIGEGAFSSCNFLTSIDIPNSVTSIGEGAFSSCDFHAPLDIPNSVTSIGRGAFSPCNGLTSITIPNGVTSIEDNTFAACSGLISITIPDGVTRIGRGAFQYCGVLASIIIPKSVMSIEDRAFDGCRNIVSIVSEINSPFEFSENVFSGGIYATATLIVPTGKKSAYKSAEGWGTFDKIVEDGDGGILGCLFESDGIFYRIEEDNTVSVRQRNAGYSGDVLIPSQVCYNGKNYDVTSIGEYAFNYCYLLTSIVIPNSVKKIDQSAFYYCNGLNSIIVGERNTVYDSRNNCNAIIVSETNELIVGCKNTIIPNGVTRIGHHAFYDCYDLTSIDIPNSVTSIGGSAFDGCSGLTSIEIPSSVTRIEYNAFSNCFVLRHVYNLSETVLGIDSDVFWDTTIEHSTLYVPEGSSEAYNAVEPWNRFGTIVEMKGIGDVNCDNKVDQEDRDAIVNNIMCDTPAIFNKKAADLNGDNKVNVVDLVLINKQD